MQLKYPVSPRFVQGAQWRSCDPGKSTGLSLDQDIPPESCVGQWLGAQIGEGVWEGQLEASALSHLCHPIATSHESALQAVPWPEGSAWDLRALELVEINPQDVSFRLVS